MKLIQEKAKIKKTGNSRIILLPSKLFKKGVLSPDKKYDVYLDEVLTTTETTGQSETSTTTVTSTTTK